MLKLSQTILNNLKSNRPLTLLRCSNLFATSTPIVVEAKQSQSTIFENEADTDQNIINKQIMKPQNSMVAAAFAMLKPNDHENKEIKTPFTDQKIDKAANVSELLSISEGNGVSRRHALKVVSILSDWFSSGKVKLSDFENDLRFIKLCRILTKGTTPYRHIARSEDLSTVINITADDEAARLVDNLTVPQLVKVMSTLSQKRRRSIMLLRSLAYNITASSQRLNLKQCADILFSMSTLNFHDDNLLTKVCTDLVEELGKSIEKSTTVGSIITSLGLLKYKDPETLDLLSEWVLVNHSICRPQDLFSIFITLATLNYTPSNSEKLFNTLIPQLSESESKKPVAWLNVVWALVLMNQASSTHISSVLSKDFLDTVEDNTTPATKLKLLNINGAALHLIKNYNGPTVPPSSHIHNVNIGRTKEKNELVEVVIDTLKNLLPTENHLNTNVNSGFGFFIDAKCLLDKKCNPLPVNVNNEARAEVTKVALLVHDYHDMCHGKIDATGINAFACKLLQAQGYKVITVSYTDFKITDKLIQRVQYLETKLKSIVK